MRGKNNRNRGGMMIVGRDSNGKLIRIAKSYSEAWKEKKLREEEEKSNGEPEETRQPRWSDENLAVHIWTDVNWLWIRKGVFGGSGFSGYHLRNLTRTLIIRVSSTTSAAPFVKMKAVGYVP
ncbi:hypothetical protein Tco_1269858 [Tanacetum coccineum]